MKKQLLSSPIELLIAIVERYKGEEVIQFLKEHNIFNHIDCFGYGTAESELLDLFGFGIQERDIIISLVPNKISKDLLNGLNEQFHFNERHTGLAFTAPLNSAEKQVIELLNIKLEEK